MERINFKPLAGFVLATLVLSGCSSLKQMKKHADDINYTVTPEILEAHGGNVGLAVQGSIPEKYFVPKASLTATPVLVYANGETAYAPYSLQGEKVQGNAKVISKKEGGSFSYNGSVPFKNDMRDSDLEVRIVASKGKKSVTFDPIKIADGVIATSTLVDKHGAIIRGVQKEKNTTGKYDPTIDEFQRIVPNEYQSELMYLINSSFLRGSEAKKEDIKKLAEYIKDANADERKDLKGLDISAYASPDGELNWNDKLSKKRQGTSSSFVNKQLKKSKVETNVTTQSTPEDWDGFKELMEQSSIQDKDLILRVLSMYSDPETREKEIKNLSEAYTEVAEEILPQLRRAKLTASVDLIGKTDAELMDLAINNPSALNQAELIYAATLFDDLDKQEQIFKSFISQWGDDWRGYNNLGMVKFAKEDYSAAKANFEKADNLDANNPVIQNNLAASAIIDGDNAKAEEFLGAASGAGDEVNYNMGILNIIKGEYDAAVSSFGSKESANAALAKLLAGDNNGALRMLNSIEPTALSEYLKAVVGARTAKESLLFDSLKSAISKDAKYKDLAKTDMEFIKYLDNDQFKSIVG